jgi:hypothetical protein
MSLTAARAHPRKPVVVDQVLFAKALNLLRQPVGQFRFESFAQLDSLLHAKRNLRIVAGWRKKLIAGNPDDLASIGALKAPL